MTKPFHISLKAGERIFVNGAVLRVDRKVTLEFLNDVTFLLESHVIQPEQTTTPLKQLYFIVQTMLVEPANAALANALFEDAIGGLMHMFKRPDLLEALVAVQALVRDDRNFEALKKLRALFPIEAEILAAGATEVNAPIARETEVA